MQPATNHQQSEISEPRGAIRKKVFSNRQSLVAGRQSGFTIIEAVVAVSVFAFAAVSIVGVYIAVQRLNQTSQGLQALEQNGRFVIEDITKLVRNGQVDYAKYPPSGVPQPVAPELYLLDREGTPIHIYVSGTSLILDKTGVGTANYTGAEVKVLNFRAYIWPERDPFQVGGRQQQPTVTVFLDLQSNLGGRNPTEQFFQTTIATRQYPQLP